MAGAATIPSRGWAAGFGAANSRPVVAYLGAGIRYRNLMREAMRFGPCAAICDVDSEQLRKGADAYYYAAV
ncbi:MAG: hypothetical protein AAF805_09740, partial [Planctomycetota bacterium]